MTNPPLGSLDYTLGDQSQIFKDEYSQFLARQRSIMDSIISTAGQISGARQALPAQVVGQQMAGPAPVIQPQKGFWENFFAMPQITPDSLLGRMLAPDVRGTQPRTAQMDELMAQAHFWDIENPEQMTPQQLYQLIQQRRAEMPRDQQTDAGSASLAFLGAASAAGGATSRIVGNIFGDVGAIPFAGPALAKILKTEEAKKWMYDLSMRTSEFTEAARAAQPLQDLGAFDVMAASGKVAGTALPAMLVWRTIGSAAGVLPESWGAAVSSPFLRAALQGGITGTVLEAGSDEPTSSKVFNIGLGAALGAATALPKIGASIGAGVMGAEVGSQVGDTPEDRTRHAIEGGIAGALLGLAPLLPQIAAKVTGDLKSPFDAKVQDAVKALPDGTPPQQAQARMVGQQALPSGPDYEFVNDTPQQPQLLVRSEAPQAPPEPVGGGMTQRLLPPPASTPEEIVAQSRPPAPPASGGKLQGTVVTGQDGQPLTVYHGTGQVFDFFDLSKADGEALYGPGFYHTENPEIATGYALGPSPNRGEINNAGANLRPAKLNIQNPFDINKSYSPTELRELVDKLESALPGYDWGNVKTSFTQTPYYERPGDEIYSVLENVETLSPTHGVTGEEYHQYNPDMYGKLNISGKVGANIMLQTVGYDGIKYIGGARTGNDPHQVWVAFKPEQVFSPWEVDALSHDEAATSADQLTKQATITESPNLPFDVGKAQITDSDVVHAAKATNPGGVTVIRNIQAPLRVIQDTGPGVTFVQRPWGFDALVGDVSPEQVQQYSNYGIFNGQKVTTAAGVEGEVAGMSNGMVKVKTASGGVLEIRPDKVLPSRFSAPRQAPDLWEAFKNDLLSYANYESEKAGMQPVMSLFDSRVPQMMAQHQSDFLDRQNITDPGLRQAIDADFNHRWTQELRDLDPESRDLQNIAAAGAVAEGNGTEASPSHNIPVSLEEKAEKRGFIWLSAPGGGGSFKDTINPGSPDVPVSTDASAHEFLARVDRTLPDYTPVSEVPLDVATKLPEDLTREPRLSTEDFGSSLSNTLDHFASGGGGGELPPGPPPGAGSASGGGGWQLPSGENTLAKQFAAARLSDPVKVYQMTHDFQGLLGSKLRYTRYAMLGLEKNLNDMGIDLGRAWEHYEALETARTHGFNEGQPWIQEWSDIMGEFPGRVLRDGTVTRVHEIEDPNARYSEWWRLADSHDLSDGQIRKAIAADDRITDFNHRFFDFLVGDPSFSLTADREIFRYMSHVRARQAQGMGDSAFAVPLSPEVQFFAEHARHTNMQFRIMDARDLGYHMVRAAMFKKWQAEPWEQMVSAWELNKPMTDEASPIPLGLRQYMADYANIERYGYNPGGELAVRGVQSVLGRVGVPVTTREAQHLLNMPQSAMYMSMLAGRSSIFFRDATQPLLALAKVELPYMASTYGKVLKGASQTISRSDLNVLREMYQRGLDGGWVEKENPNIEAAGYFEEQPQSSPELERLSAEQVQRRELLARIGDAAHGLPAWLVRPSESNLSTLKWYGREGQLNRMIVGEAAYQQAASTLKAYRQSTVDAVLAGDPSQEMPFDKMMDKGYFNSFEPPIQRKLAELINSGDDEGAANLFAREVTNWSQYRYGRREAPQALRGNVGRMVSMLGSWTGQFLEATASALSNGSMRQKARFASIVGAFSWLMYEAKQKTGWSFDRWAWIPQGVVFTGSPILEHAARGLEAVQGLGNLVQGYGSNETQTAAMAEEFGGRGGGPPLASEFLPWTGYVRSAAELHAAMQGTNPVEQIARYMITGDHGSRVDMQRMIEEAAARHGMAPGSLSPNGGLMPHRPGEAGGYGTPQAGYGFPTAHPGAGAWE